MDWQIIGIVGIGAAALVAFFVLGRPKETPMQSERKVQGLDVLKPTPVPQAHTETTRRFIEALKAQS